jgi:hypothetical protein
VPVLRKHHDRDYTVIPNVTIEDPRLSCRDLGLLVFMLHKPQDWKFTKQALLTELGQDGERSIQSGMKKLQELGYLEITRESRKKGKLARSIWTVRDVPQLQNAVMAKQSNEQTESSAPQLRYPSVQNAADYKRKNNKKKAAVSAVEGGAQLPMGFYKDPVSGEWRRRENA